MIRVPNPKSTIDEIVDAFKTIYVELSDYPQFTIDDMAKVLTIKLKTSSSGYTGGRALAISYETKDKSLNSMYAQAKSYSEVLRLFGWIQAISGSSSTFTFTALGKHVVASIDHKKLVNNSLLGI